MPLTTETKDLAKDVTAVFIQWLKQHSYLSDPNKVPIVGHHEATIVTPPVLHVSSSIKDESPPNSGIYLVETVLTFRYIAGKFSQGDLEKVWGAIGERLTERSERGLANSLTALAPTTFLCFSCSLSEGETQAAQENERERTIKFELNCARL
jgi:hypothetical protein